ncbi:MAG: LLM class flavin-dependent oxidoreductase [Acidimicrobiia bacterium]|nr:LLM class flavin-dependent oxidoreductase [Acidimicrobiia bacterium]
MDYALQVSGSYDRLLEAAAFARRRGLVALALPDHYLMALSEDEAKKTDAPDAFVQFGGLARETTELDLVMLVSPITFRHPAVLAKMAMTLDDMSGGRFCLGVGTGWMDLEHEVFGIPYPSTAQRFELLEDALGYLTAAFDPDTPGYEGDHFHLRAFPLQPSSGRRIPIVIGGTGPHKTPSLAGRFADEFNVYPGPDIAARIDRMRAAAAESGRDPDSIRLSSSGQVVAAATESEFNERMDRRAAEAGITRDELDAHYDKRQTPRGTYEQVRLQLEEFGRLGVSRFYFQGIYGELDTDELMDGLGI